MSLDLSVVIPVFNEGDQLAPTIGSATRAILEASRFQRAEIVVADDGSSDGSGDAALAAETAVPVRVVRLPQNRGKFHARLAGLQEAEGSDVLLLDAGVTLAPGGLRAIELELDADPGAIVWNAHTLMETEHMPIAQFWTVVQDIAFADYQERPRRTSFGSEEFDRFPKGTTCFFAPRELLLQACGAFTSLYDDFRHSSDDTRMIRWIAARERINISPDFACVYRPRTSVRAFFRHAVVRGIVFPDSFRDPSSRFFWPMVAFYPVSAALAVAALRRPLLAPGALACVGLVAAGVAAAKGRRAEEVASVAALAPVYALGHGLGMWEGLRMVAASRLEAARR
jgi:glycosyltransferase involved in cell wall biosynthesis